jgi:hypothetical protein
MFMTIGLDSSIQPSSLDTPDWEHKAEDADPWSRDDFSGLPPNCPHHYCDCGCLFSHHGFHSLSRKVTQKCIPAFEPPPPTPLPLHAIADFCDESWPKELDILACPTIHPDPLSHFWPGPLHLSKKAVKALTARARTLAHEDADEIATLAGTDSHYVAPPNPLIVTNGDSMGNHYTDPIPRFSSLCDLLKWLYDEGFRLDTDPY